MADDKKPHGDGAPTTHAEAVAKLGALIKDIRIAMLTTWDDERRTLRSRPMAAQTETFDGKLYFFTRVESAKVHELEHERGVNVSFSNPDDQVYVSVSGTTSVSQDRALMKRLWNPLLKTWFPEGFEDPTLSLLVVDVEAAEYWDSPSSVLVHLYGSVKATLTGKSPDPGENEKLTL